MVILQSLGFLGDFVGEVKKIRRKEKKRKKMKHEVGKSEVEQIKMKENTWKTLRHAIFKDKWSKKYWMRVLFLESVEILLTFINFGEAIAHTKQRLQEWTETPTLLRNVNHTEYWGEIHSLQSVESADSDNASNECYALNKDWIVLLLILSFTIDVVWFPALVNLFRSAGKRNAHLQIPSKQLRISNKHQVQQVNLAPPTHNPLDNPIGVGATQSTSVIDVDSRSSMDLTSIHVPMNVAFTWGDSNRYGIQ